MREPRYGLGTMDDWTILIVCALLGAYGVWMIRRDMKRGRASARGFGFDRSTQPRRYVALMAFNCLAVALVLMSGLVAAAGLLGRLFSN